MREQYIQQLLTTMPIDPFHGPAQNMMSGLDISSKIIDDLRLTNETGTERKTIFSFSKCFEKMVLPKKSHWNMIFLVLSGKIIFLFPENMILFFRHKRKYDLSQKNTWKYDIFFKCSEKMVFPRNLRRNMIFLVIFGKMVFLFSRKYNFFSLGVKWKKMIFIKKRVKIWYFLDICVGVTSMTLPSWQKKQGWPCPEKIHLGVISPASPKKIMFILENMVFLLKYHTDWHPRKGPRSSHQRCSTGKGVLRNFTKFTGKDLSQSLFFKKATVLRPATLLGLQHYWKRSPGAGVFLWILRNF